MLYVSHIPLVNALNFVNLPLVSKGPSFIIDDQNLGLRVFALQNMYYMYIGTLFEYCEYSVNMFVQGVFLADSTALLTQNSDQKL